MDSNEISEIASHRQHLQFVKNGVLEAHEMCARARSTVQESLELLRKVDDLEPSLRKNKTLEIHSFCLIRQPA
jgi:hypothetical protein